MSRIYRWAWMAVFFVSCAEPSPPLVARPEVSPPSPPPEDPPSAEPEPAPAPEPEKVDIAAEIAWAQAAHSEDLAKVSFESLAAELEAWVPEKGELEVYLSSDRSACKKALLSRPQPDEPDEEGGSVELVEGNVDPTLAHELIGKINIQEHKKGKVLERSYQGASFGHFFQTQSGGGTELLESGKLVDGGVGYGIGEPDEYQGTLSRIDDEVAVFGGVPVGAMVHCNGPIENWKCPSGGERDCDSCQRSSIELVEAPPPYAGGIGLTGIGLRTQEPCKDSCPKRQPPDGKRIEALFARAPAWTLSSDGEPAPTLYKSRKRCLAERSKRKAVRPPVP